MKIATYNVNGISARLPVLIRWLSETDPDIVCLQELKAVHENFPIEAISAAGYKAAWQGQKSWNGVAILSKTEINAIRNAVPGNSEDLQSRYLEAQTSGLLVCCLYLPNGNPVPGPKLEYKLEWLRRFTLHAKELVESGLPVVLAGDFNIIPDEKDVYKTERVINDAVFLPEVRASFQEIIAQGWTDAIRKIYPEERIFTYWDYFRNAFQRDSGMRIDHFLINPVLSEKLVDAGVDRMVRGWEKTSDHAPVWIEIEE